MRGLKITVEGDVTAVTIEGDSTASLLDAIYKELGVNVIEYASVLDGEGLGFICDEEGLFQPDPKVNALASLLHGINRHHQPLIGDVLIASPVGAGPDEDWGDDPHLEVKVLDLVAKRVKEAMLQ